jgi:HEAT repeat protein
MSQLTSLVAALANAQGAYYAPNQLGWVGADAKEAVPSLIEWLTDHREHIRHAALMDLAAMGGESDLVGTALIRMLKSDVEWTREAAACALGLIGPKAESAIPDLILTLNDPDSQVRASSAAALARVGSTAKSVIDALIGMALGCVPRDRLLALVALEALTAVEKVNS